MSGVVPVFDDSPITCDVVEAVAGGQLVEARAVSGSATQRPCGVAGAASVKVIGVAIYDATNATQSATLAAPLPPSTAVAVQGTVGGITYAASATYGQRLIAAAGGKVTPYTPGTDDFGKVVGYCAESAGVTSSGSTKGRVRLQLA